MSTATPENAAGADSTDRQAHKDFLERYYKAARSIYDLTRKYYLFGRDTALVQLAREPWSTLVEVGSGTGRNLGELHALKPGARLGGIDAADAMLEHARMRHPYAAFARGFAEDADLTAVLGQKPDRVLLSYCLSMVQDREAAIANARAHLSPNGQLVVVDFADLAGLPGPLRAGLDKWLRTFHVEPLDPAWLAQRGARIEFGYGRYFLIARFDAVS